MCACLHTHTHTHTAQARLKHTHTYIYIQGVPNTSFYIDQQHDRVGVLTTQQVKHGMCQLVVLMLEERRLHLRQPHLVSRDPVAARRRLRDQMEIYSYQYKKAENTFQEDRVALSGKVGGMKDDICICLQLACYFTQVERQREVLSGKVRLQSGL